MENELRRVFDVLAAMVWTALPGGQFDYVNRRWIEYTGLSLDESHGWEWQAAVSPDDLPQLLKRWRSILASGEPGKIDVRVRRFDAQYRWHVVDCSPVSDDAGRIVKWYGVATDVDDVRRAEEILRRRELDFQLIVDSIPVPVAVTTPSGEIEGLNQANLDYSGKSFEEIKGWKSSDLIHPDDVERTIATQAEAQKKGIAYNVESRHRRADGVYRWYNVLGMPLRDSKGLILRWFLLLIDIDERKRAEEALQESEALLAATERELRLMIDTIPVFVAAYQPDGIRTFVNRILQDYMGVTLEEMTGPGPGGTTFSYLHPDDIEKNDKAWSASMASGKALSSELRVRRADGQYRLHSMRRVPLRNEKGDIVQWYAVGVDIEDQKRAEEALASSERNLKLIIDTIPTTAWSTRPDGYCDFLSHRWLDYAGFTADQALGWGWGTAIHPDDLDGLVDYWQSCLASGTPVDTEARMRRFDGVYRWFLFRADPLRDETGNIIKWYGTNVDIEDRKRADEALRVSERQLRLIVDTIPGLIAIFGPSGEIEGLTAQFLGYLGQTSEEFASWAINGTVHPDDLPRHVATLTQSLESGTPIDFETRLRRFDGTYRWFQIGGNPARDADGRIVRWYCLMTDVDDRKRAKDRLRQSEAFLADAQHLSRTGSFLWKVETEKIEWSDETYRIYDLDPSIPLTFDLIRTRTHPDDYARSKKVMEQARRGLGRALDYESRLLMPDKSVKYLHIVARSQSNKDGELELRGSVQDVTERRLSEEALAKARSELAHISRVTSLGAITASIAHEVNQPLAGIVTNAGTCLRMLAADPPNVEGARETAQRTIRDGNRAADVIKRLRILFNKKTSTSEPVDLNEAAREVIALSSGELRMNNVVLLTEFFDDLQLVAGDRVQLQQVILNLLRNATEAMSAVEDRPRHLVIATQPDNDNHVRLTVRDTGVGFGPQGMDRLFEAFHTTKSDGMGIGLFVSRSIIERHHGRLWATSNDGAGATFAFSIPRGNQLEGDPNVRIPGVTDAQHAVRTQ